VLSEPAWRSVPNEPPSAGSDSFDSFEPEDEASRNQRRRKVNWSEFWAADTTESDWLVEPFLVRGRAHALYAPAKTGKSLFALEVAAALATGRPVLRQSPGKPVNVAYLDYEMTEDDLRERLTSLGYDDACDLSHFHYYLLPNLPPLDKAEGGAELESIVVDDQAEAVVVDTTGRAVSGEEDSADTILDYYRHTGLRLKRLGATSLRVDHAGKELTRGQRGTSAKNDDVDIVWQLSAAEGGVTLKATHRRLGWVPDEVHYRRDEDPVLRHVASADMWPAQTSEIAVLLDRHGVPLDASVRSAVTTLRQAGDCRRQDLIRVALKWRRVRQVEHHWAVQ
jgi:hypothetical protein